MDYEKMWITLRHALVEASYENPDVQLYPAIILIMTALEWYESGKGQTRTPAG